MFFGSLVFLVLREMDLGMRQQESSGPLTSSHAHTPHIHDSLSGINKESAHTMYIAYPAAFILAVVHDPVLFPHES